MVLHKYGRASTYSRNPGTLLYACSVCDPLPVDFIVAKTDTGLTVRAMSHKAAATMLANWPGGSPGALRSDDGSVTHLTNPGDTAEWFKSTMEATGHSVVVV